MNSWEDYHTQVEKEMTKYNTKYNLKENKISKDTMVEVEFDGLNIKPDIITSFLKEYPLTNLSLCKCYVDGDLKLNHPLKNVDIIYCIGGKFDIEEKKITKLKMKCNDTIDNLIQYIKNHEIPSIFDNNEKKLKEKINEEMVKYTTNGYIRQKFLHRVKNGDLVY